MSIILSILPSIPSTDLTTVVSISSLLRTFFTELNSISLTSVDFPLPETPVTPMNFPSGNFTLTSLRLFFLAFLITICSPLPSLLSVGTGIFLRPDKYAPVIEFSLAIISSGVPTATTCPPCSPALGPISTI